MKMNVQRSDNDNKDEAKKIAHKINFKMLFMNKQGAL